MAYSGVNGALTSTPEVITRAVAKDIDTGIMSAGDTLIGARAKAD